MIGFVVVVVAVDTNVGRSQHLGVCASSKRHALVDNRVNLLQRLEIGSTPLVFAASVSKRCFLWSTVLDALIYTMAVF